MEDQRGREMRNKRNPMSTNVDEGVQKTANGGGLFTADHSAFDIHRGQKFMGDVIDGENVHRLTAGKDAKMTVPTFISGGGGGDGNAINDTNGWNGVIGHGRRWSSFGLAQRPILPPRLSFRSSGYVDYEEPVNQEFGRNTNRLDYFRVDPFDVYGDHHLPRVDSFGGGGGPRQEYEGDGDSHVSHVAGGGMRIRRVPVGLSANDGGEGVVERLDHRGGNEGGGGSREVVGPRLEQERGGGATAGAGSVDGTREVPVGTFGDNCGETVVQKLKQEGATVAVPVVVVAVAIAVMVVMMMVLVMVMVVLVSVMAKMESRR